MKIKLFNSLTCSEILEFKEKDELRDLYNQQEFVYDKANYLNDILEINFDPSITSMNTKSTGDLESSMIIFQALPELDLVQANDKRLWVTLSHILFYKYSRERWNINSNTSNNTIKDRFHFEGSGLRARNQNSIARLWWASKITYDKNRQDPFELTKVLWSKQDFYQNIIDRKFSIYSCALRGFLNFYQRNPQIDLKYEMRKLIKGINALGGVRVLPMYNELEIEQEILKLCNFYKIQIAEEAEV